jgi:hypothetical protein
LSRSNFRCSFLLSSAIFIYGTRSPIFRRFNLFFSCHEIH